MPGTGEADDNELNNENGSTRKSGHLRYTHSQETRGVPEVELLLLLLLLAAAVRKRS